MKTTASCSANLRPALFLALAGLLAAGCGGSGGTSPPALSPGEWPPLPSLPAGLVENLSVTVLGDTFTELAWDVTTPTTAQVQYGRDASYGGVAEPTGLSYFHAATITGLSPGTTYHYRIRARGDALDGVTEDGTFTTRTSAELAQLIRNARADGGLPRTYTVAPSQSIASVVAQADVGDTIYLLDGTWYGEQIDFPRSGIPEAPITLAALGNNAVLDGQNAYAGIQIGTYIGVDARNCINVRGLRLKTYGKAIEGRGGTRVNVSGCEVYDTRGIGIYFIDLTHSSVTGCDVHDNGWNSVMLQATNRPDTGHLRIAGCTIHDNPGSSGEVGHMLVDLFAYRNDLRYIDVADNELWNCYPFKAIYCHNGPDEPTLFFRHLMVRSNRVSGTCWDGIMLWWVDHAWMTQNTVVGAGTAGLEVYDPGSSSDVTIKNNIAVQSGWVGIHAEKDSFVVACNDSWGSGDRDFLCPDGPGNISVDPLFADPGARDFHLKSAAGRWNGTAWVLDAATSPCIDAGDPASPFDAEPAPNGGRINLGAYGNTAEASGSP